MAQSAYRLFVADIDGTLLDSSSQLRPAVVEAVAAAEAAGIVVTLATGRRYVTAQGVIASLGFLSAATHTLSALQNRPVVLQTGAVVVSSDGQQVFEYFPLPFEDAQRAVDVITSLGLQPILYEKRIHEQRLFSGPPERDTPGASTYLTGNPHLVVRVPYTQLLNEVESLQIAVIGDLAPLEAAVPLLRLANCRTIISYSHNLESYFMEVFHSGCSKGSGVQRLCALLGIGVHEVVTIGDNWNDVEMLALAGCGIAMGNSAEGITAYARRTTVTNDQDAVAQVLRQLVAGEEPGQPNPEYIAALATAGAVDRAQA